MVYGTAWKKERTADLVYEAIKAGFRGIDTAAMKRHYDEVGTGEGIRRAIQDGIVTREDLWVPSFPTTALELSLTTANLRSKPNTLPLTSPTPRSQSSIPP